MFLEPSSGRGVARPVSASTVIHLLVVSGIVLGYEYLHPARVVNPGGTRAGTRIDLVYLPGSTPASASHPVAKPKAAVVAKVPPSSAPVLPALPSRPLPAVQLASAAPTADNASMPSGAPDQTKGSNSWGTGDAEQIALTMYSPSPTPDLSVLPRGMQGDVVVDITINADGKVSDLTVLKTPGYGLESSVANTVRTWTFRPATKDGVPVASVQELLFHFGRPA
jgi:periplasmic protein TonB